MDMGDLSFQLRWSDLGKALLNDEPREGFADVGRSYVTAPGYAPHIQTSAEVIPLLHYIRYRTLHISIRKKKKKKIW